MNAGDAENMLLTCQSFQGILFYNSPDRRYKMYVNAMKEKFEHIELFGKPVLFTNYRIAPDTVPENWFVYDLRGGGNDPGIPVALETKVIVNHAGSILTPEQIPFLKGKNYRSVKNKLNFIGEGLTLIDFCRRYSLSIPLTSVADPELPHTYNWYVITNCGSPKEQIQQDMTLEEAIRVYQDTDEKEKRLGVAKDKIATVDLVHLADHEQRFFGDYQAMDCFKDDPVILQAVQMLHQALGEENPVQGMTMGGM